MRELTPEQIAELRKTWGTGPTAAAGQRAALGTSKARRSQTTKGKDVSDNGNGTTTERAQRKYRTPAARTEPVTFELNDIRFDCHAAVPGVLLTDMWAIISGDDEGKVLAAHMLDGVFWQVMDEAEYERFSEYVNDQDHLVHSELLLQISLDLLAEYTGRPFGLPSPSPAGPRRTRATSTAASPSSDSV